MISFVWKKQVLPLVFKVLRKVKTLFRILSLVETVTDENDQIIVKMSKNLLIDVDGSTVIRSNGSIVLKVSDESGLLFLNPSIEDSNNTREIVAGAERDYRQKMTKVSKPDNNCPL